MRRDAGRCFVLIMLTVMKSTASACEMKMIAFQCRDKAEAIDRSPEALPC